jgi:signal transduction histidine kinase
VAEALAQLQADVQDRRAQVGVRDPLPAVVGHHTTLVQVVANLLANAIKYAAPGAQPRVQIWAEAPDQRVRLWVEDHGIGIAPEHHERIFRAFERLHDEQVYPGTGIGLAIVRKGIERMGGRVGLESTPGQGSRFWLELPKP